ncbi:Tyrosine--tRNA ligase [Geodia barretti]|uniref:tyrosine--tRNA ligase n=1 Tax=Geodia barretti TaxID=519541 RepID=A0AA35TIB3_GEOBA|nr:Tyrosine--tRNA ligase [Geodia barretti]
MTPSSATNCSTTSQRQAAHHLPGARPDKSQHAHRPPGGVACPALVPASRPSRHSPDWRLYRTHRRPVRPPGSPQRLTHAQVLANAETYAEQFSRISISMARTPRRFSTTHGGSTKSPSRSSSRSWTSSPSSSFSNAACSGAHKEAGGLYLNEMIYPILQGYDSVAMEVDAELGGSDQLFNMMRGRDLVEAYLGKTKHVLTTQLLEGLDGRKMSKTYGNTVDLTEDPVPMFFKLTLVQDSKLPRFMQVLTDRRTTK